MFPPTADPQPPFFSLSTRDLAALSHADVEVRRRALEALATVEVRALEPSVRYALGAALRPLLGDDDPHVQLRVAVLMAVGLDDGRARGLLLELAHAPTVAALGVLSGTAADVAKAIRLEAIRALAELRDAATRAVLRAILRDLDGEVRQVACEALGVSGDMRAMGVLRRIEESDADPRVREAARVAMADLRGDGAAPSD